MAQANATKDSRDPLSLGALALAATLAQGCTSLPPAEVRHQADLGAIAVVAGTSKPELSFRSLLGSKAEGAVLGAGASALLNCTPGFSAATACVGGGPICGVVLAVWAGICGIATVTGAVFGAAEAPRAQTVRESEAAMADAVSADAIQAALREQVLAVFAARGRQPIEPARADTLVEVALLWAGLAAEPEPQLRMRARVRLLRRSDGAELSATEYLHTGPRHSLAAWGENNAARLLAAVQAGYESLGSHIYDNVFLLYPFPDREFQPGSILVAAYGLAPLEPPLMSPFLTTSRVESLQPTLRWQAFPRAQDLAASPEDMARVRNVRYDLVIARSHKLAPAKIVYRREALPQPEHTVQTPLAAGTEYFWTVRARFELDGRERVTSWGTTDHFSRERLTVPSSFSYRFRTP